MKPTTSKLSDKLAEEWCVKLLINGNERTRLRHGLSELIYGIISQPWLGNASTGLLLDEIRARVDCGYATVQPDDPQAEPAYSCTLDGSIPSTVLKSEVVTIGQGGNFTHWENFSMEPQVPNSNPGFQP